MENVIGVAVLLGFAIPAMVFWAKAAGRLCQAFGFHGFRLKLERKKASPSAGYQPTDGTYLPTASTPRPHDGAP